MADNQYVYVRMPDQIKTELKISAEIIDCLLFPVTASADLSALVLADFQHKTALHVKCSFCLKQISLNTSHHGVVGWSNANTHAKDSHPNFSLSKKLSGKGTCTKSFTWLICSI
jgi:hypothetical protein